MRQRSIGNFSSSFVVEFKNGIRAVLASSQLVYIFAIAVIATIAVLSPFNSHLPNYVYRELQANAAVGGGLFAVFSMGMIVGGIGAFVLKVRMLSNRLLATLTFTMIVGFYGVFYMSNAIAALGLVLLCGLVLGITSAIVPNMIERKTNIRVMGRVMGLYSMVLVLGPALGSLLFEQVLLSMSIENLARLFPLIFLLCIVVTFLSCRERKPQ